MGNRRIQQAVNVHVLLDQLIGALVVLAAEE